MQKDMHYYGTYAMARAAGINPDAAKIIANCAQFVDDNAANTTLKFGNGAWIESIATAHHTLDKSNLDQSDQRRVWIPFHFIPGNQGDGWTERLKCRMDSKIVREMIKHHLSFSNNEYSIELIGVAAHVYADTFAHYGFSGISSRGNKINNNSISFKGLDPDMENYITDKFKKFKKSPGAKLHPNFQASVENAEVWWKKMLINHKFGRKINSIISWVAETASGALGHGSVATFPDRPYLDWKFEYERSDGYIQSLGEASDTKATRPNPKTFLKGCEALYNMFVEFRIKRSDLDNHDCREFESISKHIYKVLSVQKPMAGRIEAWQVAAAKGTIFGSGETIPLYEGEDWNEEWKNLDKSDESDVVLEKSIWHFYQAASMHRTYVLRDLLPSHGIIVD